VEIRGFPQTVAWALDFLSEVHPSRAALQPCLDGPVWTSGSPKYEDRALTPNRGEDYWQNRILDQAARQQISHELGHNRIDVALFLNLVLTSSQATRQRHTRQAERMCKAIDDRWAAATLGLAAEASEIVSASPPEGPCPRDAKLIRHSGGSKRGKIQF